MGGIESFRGHIASDTLGKTMATASPKGWQGAHFSSGTGPLSSPSPLAPALITFNCGLSGPRHNRVCNRLSRRFYRMMHVQLLCIARDMLRPSASIRFAINRHYIETAKWNELVIGTETTIGLSYTVLEEKFGRGLSLK